MNSFIGILARSFIEADIIKKNLASYFHEEELLIVVPGLTDLSNKTFYGTIDPFNLLTNEWVVHNYYPRLEGDFSVLGGK